MSHAWMPLYVADYLADTRRLSTLEHGAYVLLIMEYWQQGSLPDDDAQLSQIALMAERDWKRIRSKIASFFQDGWRHNRIDVELAKAGAKSVARAGAGARGGEAKAKRAASKREAIATNLPKQTGKQKPTDALASSSHTQYSDTSVSDEKSSPEENLASEPRPKPYPDARHELWAEGPQMLESLGVPKSQARSTIGKWLKHSGDANAGAVFDAIRRATLCTPVDPIPWIFRALPHAARAPPGRMNGHKGPMEIAAERAEKRRQAGTPHASPHNHSGPTIDGTCTAAGEGGGWPRGDGQ